MTIKNLFNKNESIGKVISNKSLSDMTSTHILESVGVISASYKKYDQLLPNIDFSDPANFVKYGLAEKYYENSIEKIAYTYPYDGSKKQKLEWRNNASYLDLYLFEKEYPRHTGCITIGTNFGTASVNDSGYYTTPTRTEYIKIGPGLSTGSIYNTDKDRITDLSFNSENGFCVEFWMKSDPWSTDLATASYQCIFDIGARDQDQTSSLITGFPAAYRFSVITTGTTLRSVLDDGSGFYGSTNTHAFSFSEWNRFSINVLSGGIVQTWKNGIKIRENLDFGWPFIPVKLTFSGTIGSFSTIPGTFFYNNSVRLGWNKFSGSLDDFRFWRRSRTEKEIVSNWFCDVDGGFDKDELLNPDMGFYYKFNESTVGTASYDARILDYSGRRNNATWIGYQSGSRIDYSPMINEFRDPILHLSSSRVYSLLYSKTLEGREYDLTNNGSIINLLPGFLYDEDENEHFTNLTQIIASMFDRLWLQINSLTNLKDTAYFNSGSFPSEVLLKALSSNGLDISNILDDYTLREIIEQKSDGFSLENSIEEIKQIIYKNIYNNLIYIYKAKGTEKAIKSVFRSFGVDDDVIKIHAYSKQSKIEIDSSKRIDTVRRKNLLDLSGRFDAQNMFGTVFNQYIPTESGSVSSFTSSNDDNINRTIESTIIFPRKFNVYDSNFIRFPNSNLSASLFGAYQIKSSTVYNSSDCTFESNSYGLKVYAIQKSYESKDAKFSIIFSKNQVNQFYTETDWYKDVFDDSKWTLGVRYFQSGTDNLDDISYGSFASGLLTSSLNFFGFNEIAGNIIHSFSLTTDLNDSTSNDLFIGKTKLYLGANRTNFTGNVLSPTQAKFAYLRMWQNYLSNQDLINHALDAHNFGIYSGSLNHNSQQTLFSSQTFYSYLPRVESLMLNWDFENDYTPNSSGIFTVSSFRNISPFSGATSENLVPLGYNYSAIGYGFNSGSTVIDKNYIIEQKNRIPTDYYSYDDISLLDDSDVYFGRQIRPIEYFYTIENSIYNVISEDILNMFSSIDEFNILFGNPTDRYRIDYKNLVAMKNLFFSRVLNSKIDVEKYFSYYRWLDDVLTDIISKLIPISANLDSKIRNIIESHVLERNKHRWNSLNFSQRNMTASLIGKVINANMKKYIPRNGL